ncbi:MAG: SDR family oxidoreductase [Bdellovibrionota bacterium]
MTSNLPEIKHTTALITGASSGIGYEFAKLFAKNRHNLILVARNEDKLNTFAKELSQEHGVKCSIISCDLSKPGAAQEIERKVKALNLTVDYLINNAGFSNFGFFKDTDFKKESECVQVNVTALTELSKIFLPSMVAKRTGGILNVASIAAYQPGPLMAVYYATKAYVTSFSEALSNELAGTGVHVSVLCPGVTKTNFFTSANMQNSKLLKSFLPMADSASVAMAGYNGFFGHKKVIVPGIFNKIAVCSTRFIPRNLTAKIARKSQEERK